MARSLFAQLTAAREGIMSATTPEQVGDLYLEARTAWYAADDAGTTSDLDREAWRAVMSAAMDQGRRLARAIEPLVMLG